MRHIIVLIVIGVFSLIGCSKSDSIEDSSPKAITFSASVGKKTRYIVEGENYPDSINFSIWAFLKAQGEVDYDYMTPFMNDREIEKFDYGWVTKEDYFYWPVYAKLKFVAYSPYRIGTPTYNASEGLKFVDITPYYGDSLNGYDDIDFMYTEDAAATDKTQADAPVGLLFKHALTHVRFTAVTTMTNAVIQIKELKFGQVKDVGTFQTLPSPQWSNLKVEDGNLDWFILFEGTQIISNTESQVGVSVLCIPQPVAGMEVKIKYEITSNGVTEQVSKSINLSGTAWEINQKIKYALTFSMDEITFTPSTNDWVRG